MWGVLEDDRRPAHACHWGGHQYTSPPPAVLSPCLTTDSYCPPLWGLSALGEGNSAETVPCPRPPPQKCQDLATATAPSCTEDSGGHQGLPCLLLYCLCVRSPPTLSVSFLSSLLSFPPDPAPTPEFSTGKRVTPPSLPLGSPTHSCFLLFYFRVCIIYFFLPPLFCPPSSLFCHVTGGCAMSLQTAGLSGCLVLQCSYSSSLPTLSFLQCFLRAVSTIWKLERN